MPTTVKSFFRGYCNAEAAMMIGVNGNGGGITEATDKAQGALFLIRFVTA